LPLLHLLLQWELQLLILLLLEVQLLTVLMLLEEKHNGPLLS
jgi:hypothetical protein